MEQDSLLSLYSKKIMGTWYSAGKELMYQFNAIDDTYTSTLLVTILSLSAKHIYKYNLYNQNSDIMLRMHTTVYKIEVLTDKELHINGNNGVRILLRTMVS